MPKILKTILFIFITSIISFLILTKNIIDAELFEDNFDNPSETLLKWEISGPSLWQSLNNEFGVWIDSGVTNALPSDFYWNSSWQDFIYTVDLKGLNGTDKNVLIKFKDANNYYEIHHTGGNIFLDKTVAGSGYHIAPQIPYPLNNGTWYHFRIEVSGDHYIVSEGNNVLFDAINSGITFSGGKPGLRVGVGATHPSEVWYDNVVITDLSTPTPSPTPSPTPTFTPTPSPTPTFSPSPTPSSTPSPTPTLIPSPTPTTTPTLYPSLNVLDLKQYDLRWKNNIYDTANNWSSTPTIERWGCALTSASMILNYYGHNILPGSLNTWLKNQTDGYTSNGLINWIAVTRYSKIFSSLTRPALEYKRLGNSSGTLINELTNQRPAILEVPNHFVVAKSQTDASFGINDPGYSNRPTLLSYSNTFKSLRSFTPSHTNLSYILLTIDQIFNLNVLDPDGNPIDGNTYIDDPLVDDLDNSTLSGTTLKVFEFPKPNKGKYTVEIQGNGDYSLISYLYDKNGNVVKNVTNGDIENGEKDTFEIVIGNKNILIKEISLKKILFDLNKLHSKKLINNFAYNEIKFELHAVESLIRNHRYDLAKNFLIFIRRQIRIFSPWAIKPEASQILDNDILEILKSF